MGSRRRTPPPPPRAAAFDRLYAELPTIDCQGLCHDSCGPIGMTPTEHRRTTQAGVSIPHADDPNSGPLPATCPALTLLKRCAVYGQRPTICRLWGLTESMPCTYGCRPEGGLLSDAEGYEFLARAYELDGQHQRAAQLRAPFADPDEAAHHRRVLKAFHRERHHAYDDRERRAVAAGTAVYLVGPGRLDKRQPAHQPERDSPQ